MLTDIEVAALDLALQMEDEIRKGTRYSIDIILALNRLRIAQCKLPTVTQELEEFYKVALQSNSNLVQLNKKRFSVISNDDGDESA